MSENPLNENVFRFLEGDWAVQRTFEGSYLGTFSGKASFTPNSGEEFTYQYSEEGELIDGEGNLFNAKQSYLYRLEEGILQVLKLEESEWIVMHDLDFKQEVDAVVASATHTHLCGQDYYVAEYRIDLSGNCEVAYTVTGPKKDYRIHSVYTR